MAKDAKSDKARSNEPRTFKRESTADSDMTGTQIRPKGGPLETAPREGKEAPLPDDVAAIKSGALPVPGVNDKRVGSHENWQERRDRALAKGAK